MKYDLFTAWHQPCLSLMKAHIAAFSSLKGLKRHARDAFPMTNPTLAAHLTKFKFL